jgi:hypothetical protein
VPDLAPPGQEIELWFSGAVSLKVTAGWPNG